MLSGQGFPLDILSLIGHKMESKKCKYQVDSGDPGLHYCLNGSVHSRNNIVTSSICKNCPHKDKPAPMIRQAPSKEDVDLILDTIKQEKISPPITQQATNVIQAVSDTYNSLVAGNPLFASKETAEARWKTCEGCEYRNGNTCSLCGCGLKAKTQLASQSCPAGRWSPEVKGSPAPKNEIPGKPKWAE